MSIIGRDQYSRKQTRDLEGAMRLAIVSFVRDRDFPGPQEGGPPIRFSEVFDEWPNSNDRHVTPAACVLPAGKLIYSEARTTPTLIEETWEPRGALGLGLYALAEGEKDFQLEVRAASKAERRALVAGIEPLLVADGVLVNRPQGARYGVVQPMPEYWGMTCRLSMQDKSMEDTEDSAQKGRWEVLFTIRAQATLVRLDRVAPFTVTIRESIE